MKLRTLSAKRMWILILMVCAGVAVADEFEISRSTIDGGGVMHSTGLVEMEMMSIPDQPCTAGKIMKALGEKGINVQFIVQCIDAQNNDQVAFCVSEDQLEPANEILEQLRRDMGTGKIVLRSNMALISIFGPDFRERPGIAGTMFSALCKRDINILAISTSISTLSCVIDADRLDDAIAVMYETFDLPQAGREG